MFEALLVAAGFIVGVIGVVSRLASIVSSPVLLAAGLPLVPPDVINTVALVGAGVGALMNSLREVTPGRGCGGGRCFSPRIRALTGGCLQLEMRVWDCCTDR
jgi:hypothetical protein